MRRVRTRSDERSPDGDRDSEPRRRSAVGAASTRDGWSPADRAKEGIGNRALQDLLEERVIQPKLEFGALDDQYEEEAERVVDAVTGMCTRCRRRYRQGVPLDCEEGEEELRRSRDESGSAPHGASKAEPREPGAATLPGDEAGRPGRSTRASPTIRTERRH